MRWDIGRATLVILSAACACPFNDHPTLGNVSERLVNNTAVEGFLNDFQMNTGWYRTSSNGRLYTMADISQNVTYSSCGTFYPIYLKDKHPNMSTVHFDYTDVEACVYDDKEECSVAYTLRIRRCGLELEYYLPSTIPYAAYCLVPQCQQGFYGPDCHHVCQCKAPGTQFCYPDTGECECHSGFKGPLCENDDVDECLSGLHNCSGDMVCFNTLGSYQCVCKDGLTFDQSSGVCTIPAPDCAQRYFGPNCTTPCSCFGNNTEFCSNQTGECHCNKGWAGTNCDTDVDECSKQDMHLCKDNEYCRNSMGSFSCLCRAGFEYSPPTGYCTECSNDTYGFGCSLRCHCNTEHSVQHKNNQWCNSVSGHCICKDGWTGFTCDADIDECKINGVCEEAHSVCKNIPGTFSCGCIEGYSNVGAKCSKETGPAYTAVIVAVSVAFVAVLVIIGLVVLWKCKGRTFGVKTKLSRTVPYKCTDTGDSSNDIHANDYSSIEDTATDNWQAEADTAYERYTNNRVDLSNDIFFVRGDYCLQSSVNPLCGHPQYPDEHVYLSLHTNTK